MRYLCACTFVVALTACTVDSDEGATSLASTTVPGPTTTAPTTTAPTTTAPTTSATSVSSTTDDTATTGESETSAESSPPESTDTQTEDASSGSATGPDEQPDSGLYSPCESTVDCFGATLCVLIGAEGFCSNNCAIASDCGTPPAGTAPPACVTAQIGGEMLVCALDCAAGECPGGMACMPLGAAMVCV